MVKTREENAADMAYDERMGELGDEAIAQEPALVPDEEIEYDEWLELTGKDDSFRGDGQTIPGSEDIYYAAMRAFHLRPQAPVI